MADRNRVDRTKFHTFQQEEKATRGKMTPGRVVIMAGLSVLAGILLALAILAA